MKTLLTPLDAIVFDCDGTLSAIEGIVELAKINGQGETVEALTATAMGVSGLNAGLYAKRLHLTQPTYEQVIQLGQDYILQLTPDTLDTFAQFTRLNKPIFIVSAGLKLAVDILGAHLDIPKEHIYAVDIHFDQHGRYLNFDESNPLCNNDGKRHVIQQLQKHYPRIALIGDGKNDLACKDMIERFIGFGGHYRHALVEVEAEYYTDKCSLLTVLPYCLTAEEYKKLS